MIALPDNIKSCELFTPQELQLLSSVNEIPVVDASFNDERLTSIFQYYSVTPEEMDNEIFKYAKELLRCHKVKEAWQVLLSSELL